MRDIRRMINKFRRIRVPYITEHYLSSGTHDAIIGEWNRWWLEDTQSGKEKRMIKSPANQACYRGKRRTSDIMFLRKKPNSDAYSVVGIAEIENNHKKLTDKVDSLSIYEKAAIKTEGKTMQKWPDLEFVLLCTTIYCKLDKEKDKGQVIKKPVVPAIKRALKNSTNSKMTWIIYLLERVDVKDYNAYRRDYIQGDEHWHYYKRYSDVSHFCIIQGGKIISSMGEALQD